MTLSIWRYSHLIVAATSALFLVIASITGVILSFEPISQAVQPYDVVALQEVSIAETITSLRATYDEVLEVEVTVDDFVKASIVTKEGDALIIYVHPLTGEKIGSVKEKAAIFNWVTTLHRSLFLKGIGRFFVGFVSVLLCLIAVTGLFLLAQRQGGFLKLYHRIHETNVAQRYHVILGRWLLVPIIIIAVSGVYLSAEKFSLLPAQELVHDWSALPSEKLSQRPLEEFPIFKNNTLKEVRKITFPFSEDAEDYYQIALRDTDLLVHQFTGEVLSEIPHPFVKFASQCSFVLHTGQGSILWSLVLLVASASILFFIVSGFSMTLKRRRHFPIAIPKADKDTCEYVILVGSESGYTFALAQAFQKGLVAAGKTVFLSSLNEYTTYQQATKIIVFTATYGDGEAPTNARNFESIFTSIKPLQAIDFSVIGFGSLMYPHYCKFAIKVAGLLQAHPQCKPLHPLVKINEQSPVAFQNWLREWNKIVGLHVVVTLPKSQKKTLKLSNFTVIERTQLNIDTTSLLRLRPNKRVKFASGDLLHVVPPEGGAARLYSIAKIGNDILLSVKWHPHGLCSTYLCLLKEGDILSAGVETKRNFHFPKKAPAVWLIGNGTGIAPYLGMLQAKNKIPVKLLWGGRNETSFDHYRPYVEHKATQEKMGANAAFTTAEVSIALSQIKEKRYVQDLLAAQHKEVAKTLEQGGVFMLCGSMAMQQSVLDTLEEISKNELDRPLSDFELNDQLLMDCY